MNKIIAFIVLSFLFLPSTLLPQASAQDPGTRLPTPLISKANKDTRVFYSVFVQSFYDSNNDGIGDIQGLISKLDYLKDLGIGGLWLLPVHPSPTYHKYDVEDYYEIHKDYGTLKDYKELVKKAHELDILVILDLVANHTSNRHPWFEKAIQGNKKYRDYYVWSDKSADFENEPYKWHQVRNAKGEKQDGERYYGFFWWEMPDLNYDNPRVREEIIKIGQFWLGEIGVDGFRLDAVPNFYPEDQLDKNLVWWQEFREGMDKVNPNAFIVGEIWGGSEKTSPYLKAGISAGFNFELADTIRKSVQSNNDLGIVETVKKTYDQYSASNPDFEDATLLTNHDMERIMTEFKRDVNRAKISAALMLTLPGNPFIYYGEEIGMLGEKPDEFIREPFIWNIEGEDPGQTYWEIPYASSSRTVKPLFYQKDNRLSLFNHYKSLINLRNQNPALFKGNLNKLDTSNPKVVGFYRYTDEQEAIVIINLSSEMEHIPTPSGLNGFELAFSNFNVFKVSDKVISLQPYGIFILTHKLEPTY